MASNSKISPKVTILFLEFFFEGSFNIVGISSSVKQYFFLNRPSHLIE